MERIWELLRPGVFIVIAILAMGTWFFLAPETAGSIPSLPSATQYETLISQVLADNATNEDRTESAPQQQVVNGWVARDLLSIIAKSNADLLRASGAIVETNGTLRTNPFDERVPALLGLGVLAIVWDGLTRHRPTVRTHVAYPPPTAAAA